MLPRSRILVWLLAVVSTLSAQEKPVAPTLPSLTPQASVPALPAAALPAPASPPAPSTSLLAETPVPSTPPLPVIQPTPAPEFVGPLPTEIIAHEHSVTDMLDVIPFKSEILHNTRMIRVFLPGNYFSPRSKLRKYPVLYLQDGQNVFDKATSFSGIEWQADETIDHLVGGFKIQPMFVIGIDNAGEQRASEYLPYPDPHNPQFHEKNPPVLEGTKYADFLTKELMPFLEKRYRIATGPANTAIGGSSYGAVVSLVTALNHPGVFGKVLLESPSLWVGDGMLLTDVEKAKLLPQKIYMGVGTKELGDPTYDPQIVKEVTDLEAILRKKGMGPIRLQVVVEEGGPHNETAWAQRFPEALLFLYGR
jgi:predicted alpha/beta superfamily hydrolase